MAFLRSRPSTSSTTITIVASALLALGVVMVFSASASLTSAPITENVWKHSAVRQAMFTLAALVALLIAGVCPFEFWRIRRGSFFQPSVFLILITLGLLVLVLLIGEERNGARRWLPLGPSSLGLGFQPSEVAKLAEVVFFAAYAAYIGERIRKFWSGLLPALLVLGMMGALVGKEDLGTAALLALVGGCILLAGGARIWHLILLSLPGIAGFVYLIKMEPYRVTRLTSFMDPYADPLGKGYHQIQSLITIASGGWWGQGLGCGIQKYGYLPEGRNDFIFSVICEELGIIGGIAVIALFAILLWHGRKAVMAASSDFGRLLALGATLTIGFQAAMNIAVVTVSIPTKGIALPLVSAGGSGVILLSILVGLLVNVARYRPVVVESEVPAMARPARPATPAAARPIAVA
ncbi:MAG TPA: putative peptidoglycan glycosyltransferase FtsW [Phycisphaerae bacterium]|nr:putative peptidoglycan glycosyltransferase FtsW [Phycisphaerae bacterium]